MVLTNKPICLLFHGQIFNWVLSRQKNAFSMSSLFLYWAIPIKCGLSFKKVKDKKRILKSQKNGNNYIKC